uniref:Uncharacterized protein n=1 Tax=Ditylenchus dipsaci TaxID=166011 RepID=A0A915D959_9BILA
MILLTALIGLIVLLIVMTEQPDLIFGDEPSSKLYSHLPSTSWSKPSLSISEQKATYFTEKKNAASPLTSPIPLVEFRKEKLEVPSETNTSFVNAVPMISMRNHSKPEISSNSSNLPKTINLNKFFEISSQNSYHLI